mmetsp:Transcript_6703/g.15316  ORF Transcript_6703/g.15316 Transcript_6703/m.15316 type:complete len:216 (-) Transcript_6703:1701-2348(-)
MHPFDLESRQHASSPGLYVGGIPGPMALQLASGDASGDGLDLAGAAVHLPHRLSAIDHASVVALDAQGGVPQGGELSAGDEAAECRLHSPDVEKHLVEVPSHLVPCETSLDTRHPVLQLLPVLFGPIGPIPLLQNTTVFAVLPMQLADIPHPLGALNHLHGLRLAADAASRDGSSHVFLEYRQSFLLVRLCENVRRIIRHDVVGEVVVVAFDTRC